MFRAMQAIQQQHQTRNIDKLIKVVKKVYQDFPLKTSKKVWSTLHLVFDGVIKIKGDNNYKLPHISKNRLIHENVEPLPLWLQGTDPMLQSVAEARAQPAAQAADQQMVYLSPWVQSPMSVEPDYLSLPEGRD